MVPTEATFVVSLDENEVMSSVTVLNGPNLNLLGTRRPDVYGTATLADIEKLCRAEAEANGLDLVFRQTNAEGQLLDWIHEAGTQVRSGQSIGAVINAGAWTHTSVAIRDAIEAVDLPVVEVHISNVHRREDFRHVSYISPVARGIVIGLGVAGYALAIRGLQEIQQQIRKGPG
jgi:3-dehydroquinate dehydratase II